jgi:hypothetical protein
MRIYIIAGPIGSGITEVVTEVGGELFSKGLRTTRKVYGRPDSVETTTSMTVEELITAIESDLLNATNVIDFIISGTEVNRHALAIRNHWQAESKIIFVRKQDAARALECGLSLLEHHATFNREEYAAWMQSQIDLVNDAVTTIGAEWKDVQVLDMFEFNPDKLVETDSMSDDAVAIKEYTGAKSADCVPRQLALY